ncbi:MAG TPA: hypothetical protein VMB48_07435 [Steroidobacteraceae bacterium]|nr:hypothetical protein [Steroidobacteraceae bacterium]
MSSAIATVRVRLQSTGLAAGIFLLAALPLIILNYDHGRAFSDQVRYHYPAILHFARGGGIADYPSATTPGYHVLMAAVAMLAPGSERALKLAGLALSLLLVGLMADQVARRTASVVVTAVTLLPMLLSIYILPAGVWLLPDNLAWLTVAAALILCLRFEDGWRWYLMMAATLVAAVLVRQSNLWLCALAPLAAFAPGEGAAGPPGRGRWLRAGLACAALAPACLVLLLFVATWHGLTPPSFAQRHTDLNFSAWPFLLCVLGAYGVFYLPLLAGPLRVRLRAGMLPRRALIGAIAAALVALVAPSDWSPEAGRASGLWNLARVGPVIGHHSLTITLAAAVGGATCAAFAELLPAAAARILGVAAAAFAAAQTSNHFVYERYYAGFAFILILLALALALAQAGVHCSARPQRWTLAFPLAFGVANAAVLAVGLIGS